MIVPPAGVIRLRATTLPGATMTDETIVAIFDSARRAQTAADDLIVNDVSPFDIKLYAHEPERTIDEALRAENEMHRRRSFWTWLIGDREARDTDHRLHHALYDRTIGKGRALLTVVPGARPGKGRIMIMLRAHKPLEIVMRPAAVPRTVKPRDFINDIDEADGAVRIDIGAMGHVSVTPQPRQKY
ncbi:hypothetical protein NCH01_22070 [Neoasaia chiangmaiensis]|uniref:Uncharacterized protein n=1 Tax=Neoasaia chiangmaiensis TaxID=320497 RepID=A0A1U9KQS7_9PROT|nr:hypothetical protein [Neoasaia chiangmaiensis]AQS88090.1 hypothetical protein A0U93_09190 [Neoasaia chiangmaiensis]GEN15776.1 hypothetical protein NCH01_22070 [Neoasaia chiangmaiensis]